jgi:hypothetical protein
MATMSTDSVSTGNMAIWRKEPGSYGNESEDQTKTRAITGCD